MVFVFQQCLDENIIFIEPVLMLPSGSAYHFCDSTRDDVSKACPVCFNTIWANPLENPTSCPFELWVIT